MENGSHGLASCLPDRSNGVVRDVISESIQHEDTANAAGKIV